LVIGVLVLGIGTLASPLGRSEPNQNPHQWLEERYKEATSVSVGMSHADLRRIFDEDGGLQRIPASRYVLRSCQMIKVDVEFDTEYGQAYKVKRDEELKIKSMSKPYFEYRSID
jgi:hypothetical protein